MNSVQPIRDKNKIEAMKIELMRIDYKYYILFVLGINTGLRISDLLELKVKDVLDVSHIRIWEKKTGKEKRFFINEPLRNTLTPYMASMDPDDYLFQSQKRNIAPMTLKQYYHIVDHAKKIHEKYEVDLQTAFKRIHQSQAAALLYEISNWSHQDEHELIQMEVKEVLEHLPKDLQPKFIDYIEKYQVKGKAFKLRQGDYQPIGRVQAYKILNQAADKCGLDQVGTHTLRKTFGYWHYQQYKDVAILQYIFNHSSPSVTLRYIGINQDNMDDTIRQFTL